MAKHATAPSTPEITTRKTVVIRAPKFQHATFTLVGTAPLVIRRFSLKTAQEMEQKMEEGKSASSKKKREPKSTDDLFEQARYRSPEGWDGFPSSAIRGIQKIGAGPKLRTTPKTKAANG